MPKIPQNIPPWLATFVEFAKTKERKRETQQSLDTFMQVITNQWDSFIEMNEKKKEDKPSKPRNIDHIKLMGKAMEKIVERISDAKGDDVLINQYKERVKQVVPPDLKDVFSEVDGSSADATMNIESVPVFAELVEKASKGMAQLTQKQEDVVKHVKNSGSNELKQEVAQVLEVLTQVSQNIEQMKDSLSS